MENDISQGVQEAREKKRENKKEDKARKREYGVSIMGSKGAEVVGVGDGRGSER